MNGWLYIFTLKGNEGDNHSITEFHLSVVFLTSPIFLRTTFLLPAYVVRRKGVSLSVRRGVTQSPAFYLVSGPRSFARRGTPVPVGSRVPQTQLGVPQFQTGVPRSSFIQCTIIPFTHMIPERKYTSPRQEVPQSQLGVPPN